MKLKESTLEYIKRRAWENMDAFIHLESDGHTPTMYPNFKHKDEYVLDPWEGDPDQKPTVENPESIYGWEKMDDYYLQVIRRDAENPVINKDFFNHPDTPDGWLYIGDDNVRYALGEPGNYNLVVVGLNPSKATPQKSDTTISKVCEIAKLEGFDGWIMINLYPKRSTDPKKLPVSAKKELTRTNLAIIEWLSKKYNIGRVYAAWGSNIETRSYLVEQCQELVNTIPTEQWFTKGTTKDGHPRHPSRIAYDEKMEWFPVQDYLWEFE